MGKEKKEIGMEKLIELLNEYLSPFSGYIHYHHGNEFKRTPTKSAVEGDRMLQDEYVLGKSFGFIKWLVENDKIDTESYCRITSVERKGEKDVYRDEVDSLLMLLAIQDEPIRFLCEIIK